MISRLAFAFLAVALLETPVAADPSADAVLNDLNTTARAVYGAGKAKLLARTDPVVIVAFNELILRRGGQESRVNFTPPAYHRLKSISHVSLGLYGALAPAAGNADEAWRPAIAELRAKAVAVREVLDRLELSPVQVARQRELIDLSTAFIDATLAVGRVERAALVAYGRAAAPLVLANATDAARLQLDGLHAAFEPWRRRLSAEEWARLYVLVLGSKMPRAGNLQFSYFVYAMGEDAVDKRLVYAEGIFSADSAKRLLGTLVTDRGLAEAYFADPIRMDRDLLADAADAHLLRMFGKLGRD
jgi:hypothetical protein